MVPARKEQRGGMDARKDTTTPRSCVTQKRIAHNVRAGSMSLASSDVGEETPMRLMDHKSRKRPVRREDTETSILR